MYDIYDLQEYEILEYTEEEIKKFNEERDNWNKERYLEDCNYD